MGLMEDSSALTVCLNPTLQKTLVFDSLVTGEVNRADLLRLDASGKGVNAARVLNQLGFKVRHLTQVGGGFAELFTRLCAADGVEVIPSASGADIRFCTTAIDRRRGLATELVEPGNPVDRETEERIRALFLAELPRTNLLIISGSKAPGFSPGLYPWMVEQAGESGCPVILDYRGEDLDASLPYGPSFVKINREEMIETFGGEADEIFADLYRRRGTRLIVTDGGGLVRYWNGRAVATRIPPAIRPINPIGSGDAFTAGMAAALLSSGADPAPGRRVDAGMPESLLDAMVEEGIRCGAENAARLKPGDILSPPGYGE
jgi:fructose-1-phosphate kinase PfkB-like protein